LTVSVNVGRILMIPSAVVKPFLKKMLKNNAVGYFIVNKSVHFNI